MTNVQNVDVISNHTKEETNTHHQQNHVWTAQYSNTFILFINPCINSSYATWSYWFLERNKQRIKKPLHSYPKINFIWISLDSTTFNRENPVKNCLAKMTLLWVTCKIRLNYNSGKEKNRVFSEENLISHWAGFKFLFSFKRNCNVGMRVIYSSALFT